MLLQKQELRLQRLELKANREELARTATAQENSEKELRRQADNLKATARLNAMNTLISYHLDNVNRNKSNPVAFMHDDWEKAQEYIKEIKSILNQKA